MGSGRARTTRAEEKNHREAHVAGGDMSVRAVVPPPPVDLRAVERILGYTFRDKALVERALTHASYDYYRPDTGEVVTEPSYERLEFVGDAVLNCVVARFLYWEYEELPPGPLTRLRSANVDTEKLARVAVRSGVYKYLRHRAPYPFDQIEEFRKTMSDYPLHSNGLLDPPKVLADVVEALLGAVFVDSNNIEAVWKVFERLSEPVIRLETLGKHPTSELYELCQKRRMAVRFQTAAWRETNAVEVLVDGKLAGRGTYGQKKEVAQNRAAKAALDYLKMLFANGGASPGQSRPEELQDDHMLGREEMNEMTSNHASSGESDDDGKTAVPANREELQDPMLGREEMNEMTSNHASSGDSDDDDGKAAVVANREELQEDPMLGREEIMNNMSDHTPSSDDWKTAVLQNTEELQEYPMLGREEIMNNTSDHTSSGDSDGGGKTAVPPNTEELQEYPMLGREEIMNSMPDHASSGESDDDGKTAVLANREEIHDPMLGREEIMNNMPDHASSGESDDDGKTAVHANREEIHDPILLEREGMNMSDHTPSDDGKTAVLANREELHDHMLGHAGSHILRGL